MNYLKSIDVINNLAEAFGLLVRSARKDKRLTVEEAAKRIGISKQYLSVLERGVPSPLTGKATRPKVELVDKIADVLEIPPDEARQVAGYAARASIHNISGFKIELPGDVEMVMLHSPDITNQEDADAFKEAFAVAYEITKKSLAERKNK